MIEGVELYIDNYLHVGLDRRVGFSELLHRKRAGQANLLCRYTATFTETNFMVTCFETFKRAVNLKRRAH